MPCTVYTYTALKREWIQSDLGKRLRGANSLDYAVYKREPADVGEETDIVSYKHTDKYLKSGCQLYNKW